MTSPMIDDTFFTVTPELVEGGTGNGLVLPTAQRFSGVNTPARDIPLPGGRHTLVVLWQGAMPVHVRLTEGAGSVTSRTIHTLDGGATASLVTVEVVIPEAGGLVWFMPSRSVTVDDLGVLPNILGCTAILNPSRGNS